MGLLKFVQMYVYIAVMVVGGAFVSDSAESMLLISFDKAPPPQSKYPTAVFGYSVKRGDGSDACTNHTCFFYCKLDGLALNPCPPHTIMLKSLSPNTEHNFLLIVTTLDGGGNSSAHSWFVDTIPPTATLFSNLNYTNSEKISVDITFSEACMGLGGFKCKNISNCDVILDGDAGIDVASLRKIEPGIKYTLDVSFPMRFQYGRVVMKMKDSFCSDQAGNLFRGTNNSAIVLHFDRRAVLVDIRTSVPTNEVVINGVIRTVLATNKIEDLEIFLDFSIPIKNSRKEILNALHFSSGYVASIRGRDPHNRQFVIKLKNRTTTEIIKIELQGLILGISGTPVSYAAPITFLFDSIKPEVGLSTNSHRVTKEADINVIVEFTKPVFDFDASMVVVAGGSLTRFRELSRALYSLTIVAVPQSLVSISIPEGKVCDISGNSNLASNQLEVEHYFTPTISTALYSFMSAGALATSFSASIIAFASANLEAIGGSTEIVASDPSSNLLGMIGHLQVFALSNWFLINRPIKYSETVKGLRWLVPRLKLPWKRNSSSTWPNHITFDEKNLAEKAITFLEIEKKETHLSFSRSSYRHDEVSLHGHNGSELSRIRPVENTTMKGGHISLPLDTNEYFTYFLRGEPRSARNIVNDMENYNGFGDLEMNMIWLGIGVSTLVALHLLILLFLRWRTGKQALGIYSVPRFELFLLMLSLPCISQSSTFVIRGGTARGIVIGALLLAIPASLILSICLFLIVAIFSGSFAWYKEVKPVRIEEPWYKKLFFGFTGRRIVGRWFYRVELPSFIRTGFGILFESRRGPPVYIESLDHNSKSFERIQSGNVRRAISSVDSNEKCNISMSRKLFGCARLSYVVLDLLRRVGLGIIAGAYSSPKPSQSLSALTITLVQFSYLFTAKPYISRGVHAVECASLFSEAGIFGLCLCIGLKGKSFQEETIGSVMLGLLFLTFAAQLINEWHALIKSLLRLPQPQNNSFRQGLKFAAKGLILPFLPAKCWLKVIPGNSDYTLSSIVEPPSGPMTATVVPVGSPSPSASRPGVVHMAGLTAGKASGGEGGRLKGQSFEGKDDMKRLRELAKASFTGHSKNGGASTSYSNQGRTFILRNPHEKLFH